ncbi:MAG: PQQ-binding-like beta-propeller repeat protein [Prevotellaceae bacterium]|jgi:outer membrane protein assembly factor BamB|nr:PQQ-binding-like beta-propeller repeat protein [Prevotellaceae bacterium]
MKKTISRNIAIVSAIFMLTFSVMLITNYFQVSCTNTAHPELIENLKQANEELGNNPQLQEQIRELDLMARRAYFVSLYRLKTGAAILLFMAMVFVVSLRLYFANSKNIPNKEVDPIDDWMIKSKARKWMVLAAGGVVVGGFVFALLSSPYIKSFEEGKETSLEDVLVETIDIEEVVVDKVIIDEIAIDKAPEESPVAVAVEVPKTTHSGFRGNNSLGISAAKNMPTSWNLSTGTNILWKVNIPRKGHNSPVIHGNKLFFSGADDDARELFCYELSSGKELWRTAAKNISGSPSKMPDVIDDTGLAAPTVATNGKQVCAIFSTGDVICADMEGKQLWAKNIGVPDIHYGYASSLLIYNNLLIIQYDTQNKPRVIALDVATGNQRWEKERPEKSPSWSSPILAPVNNKPQLILIGNPGISSYNPDTGAPYWRVACLSGEPAPGAAYVNGIVFGAAEYATMVAINALDGSILWKNSDILPEIASPVACNDFVFIATTYGVVATFEAQTGKLIKTMEFSTEFDSSPIVADGKIYLICTDGKVFIFSAKGDFTLLNSFETGEKTFATPAFTDKKIVVKSEKVIYCVGEKD